MQPHAVLPISYTRLMLARGTALSPPLPPLHIYRNDGTSCAGSNPTSVGWRKHMRPCSRNSFTGKLVGIRSARYATTSPPHLAVQYIVVPSPRNTKAPSKKHTSYQLGLLLLRTESVSGGVGDKSGRAAPAPVGRRLECLSQSVHFQAEETTAA